jgi:hypothetical protein
MLELAQQKELGVREPGTPLDGASGLAQHVHEPADAVDGARRRRPIGPSRTSRRRSRHAARGSEVDMAMQESCQRARRALNILTSLYRRMSVRFL